MSKVYDLSYTAIQSAFDTKTASVVAVWNRRFLCESFNLQNLEKFVNKLESSREISRQEENEYVQREKVEWTKKLSQKNISTTFIADILCKALIIYCRGHRNLNFQSDAIKLINSNEVTEQKLGLLYLTRTLPADSDFAVLLVNSVQRYMGSSNLLQFSFALNLFPTVLNSHMTDALLNSLISSATHLQPYIRKRSANYSLLFASIEANENILSLLSKLQELLFDADLNVVTAAINSIAELSKGVKLSSKNAIFFHKVASIASKVLEKILDTIPTCGEKNKLTNSFMCIILLKSIRNLPLGDLKPHENVENILERVLSSNFFESDIISATILYETIKTAASTTQNKEILSQCLNKITKFMKSSIADLKYVGMKALTIISSSVADCITEKHIQCIYECTESCNSRMANISAKLVIAMVNKENYKDICCHMIKHTHNVPDHVKINIYNHTLDVVRKYNVKADWCLTIIKLISNIVSSLNYSIVLNMSPIIERALITGDEDSNLITKKLIECITLFLEVCSYEAVICSASLLNALNKPNDTNAKLIFQKLCSVLKTQNYTHEEVMKCLLRYGSKEQQQENNFIKNYDIYSSYRTEYFQKLFKNMQISQKLCSNQTKYLNENSFNDIWCLGDNKNIAQKHVSSEELCYLMISKRQASEVFSLESQSVIDSPHICTAKPLIRSKGIWTKKDKVDFESDADIQSFSNTDQLCKTMDMPIEKASEATETMN